VFLARRDGHAAWVNPAARKVLGLSRFQPVVSEEAFEQARLRLPQQTREERASALSSQLFALSFAGSLRAVDDMVEAWGPDVYALVRDRGPLGIAIGMWLPESIEDSEADALRRAFPPDDRWLAVRGIKIFLDGTLGARTAALSFPYADDPGNCGELRIEESEIPARVSRWAERGWAVAIHAIGDRAVSLALSALEQAPRVAMGPHRIEHAQVVKRSDLPRFAKSGIVASVQPGHWRDDRGWLPARLGEHPDVLAHPLRSLARSGARLVFGSDWPVSDDAPDTILHAATDLERGPEAMTDAEASAWYTSAPR
jgi:predicted amidohydrolase YtcJ